MVLVKRYANRKMYDTAGARYITLEDIAAMVRRGEDIQVQDHASGRDLTTLVLMQAVFEEEKRLGEMLPRAVLTRLLQEGEETVASLRARMLAAFDPDRHVEEEIRRRVELLVKGGELAAEEATHLVESLLKPQDAPPRQAQSASQKELDALAEQLQLLERELDGLKKRP